MKTFFKTLAFCMIFILFLSCITSLFDFGSDDEPTGPGNIVQKPPTDTQESDEPSEPEEPSCAHVDADDNEVCDLCGEAYSDGVDVIVCTHVDADDNELCDNCNEAFEDGCDLHRDSDDDNACDLCGETFSDGQDLFGGTELINLTFSDPITFDSSNKQTVYGLDTSGVKYGIFTTENGYVNLYSTDSDVGLTKNAYVNLKFQEDGSGVSVSSIDYITVDFDFWSNGKFPKNISFIPAGTKSDGSLGYASTSSLNIVEGTDGNYLTLTGQTSEVNFMAVDEPLHITYVIKFDHANVVNSKVYVYVDGKYITSEVSPLLDYIDLIQLRILVGNHSVTEGESICFDNFTVSTFGIGDEGYTGAISELFGDTSINLTECVDSVLYNKNN